MMKRMTSAFLRLAVLSAAAAMQQAHAADLRFDEAFSTSGGPAALHYQASYRTGGAPHRVEVWRDGDVRVRRRTDDRIDVHASREAGSAEFEMSILDLERRIHTTVSRSNLYRIGSFTDWFDLAHGLRHPRGAYRLRGIAAPADAPPSLQPCSWYELAQDGQASRICWSAHDQVPMLILSSGGDVAWRITALDHQPITQETLAIRDQGFLRNDANQDIEPD
jgi:hypothetical protein